VELISLAMPASRDRKYTTLVASLCKRLFYFIFQDFGRLPWPPLYPDSEAGMATGWQSTVHRVPVWAKAQKPAHVADAARGDVFQLDMTWKRLIADAVRPHRLHCVTNSVRTTLRADGAPQVRAAAVGIDTLSARCNVLQLRPAHVLRRSRDDSKHCRALLAPVQMHQNGLWCALVVLESMWKTLIRARMMERCMFEAPLSEVEGGRGRLALYASWGSWYSLGQTHERWHVDGKGVRARLCIYLKGSQAGSRSSSSPVANWEEPSGGSRSKAKTAVPAEPVVFVGAAAHWMVLLVVAEFAFRS
jgi:hypothetical protein